MSFRVFGCYAETVLGPTVGLLCCSSRLTVVVTSYNSLHAYDTPQYLTTREGKNNPTKIDMFTTALKHVCCFVEVEFFLMHAKIHVFLVPQAHAKIGA